MNISRLKLKQNSGSSLIEVMVALFVLAIGLLGILSMQITSVQFNKSAYLHTQASFLAHDIIEGMQTSPRLADIYLIEYDDDSPTKPDCTGASAECTPVQIANWNLSNWLANVENLLPGGDAQITKIIGSNNIKIEIQFIVGVDANGAAETKNYELVTEL